MNSESSPSSAAKTTKSKSKKSLIGGQQTSSLVTSSASPGIASNAPVNKTASIINFISKMSNKKVVMSKLESAPPPVASANVVPVETPTNPNVISLISSANGSSAAPLSPKMTPNNVNANNPAEKRGNFRKKSAV